MNPNDFDLSFIFEYEEDSDDYIIFIERCPDHWNLSFNWSVNRIADEEEVSEGSEYTPFKALSAARESAEKIFGVKSVSTMLNF